MEDSVTEIRVKDIIYLILNRTDIFRISEYELTKIEELSQN
jgi:hypothetical protein